MDLREVGYDDRDWINLAQDRDQWRAYVRAAMNLRDGYTLLLATSLFVIIRTENTVTNGDLHMVECIHTISNKYFTTGSTVAFSMPVDENPIFWKYIRRSMYINTTTVLPDTEDYILKWFNSMTRWPMVLRRQVKDKFNTWSLRVSKVKYDIYGNYVILVRCNLRTISKELCGMKKQMGQLRDPSSWNPRGRFIIGLLGEIHRPRQMTKIILKKLWRYKVLNAIVLAFEDDGSNKYFLNVYTWFPYRSSSGNCGQFKDIVKVGYCTVGEKQAALHHNEHLFPAKVPKNLNGCPLRASTGTLLPYVSFGDETEETPSLNSMDGLEIRMLKYINGKMNASVEILQSRDIYPWGEKLENGTWTGLTGDLLNDKTDIAFCCWCFTKSDYQILDATVSYFSEKFTWFVPKAKPYPRWTTIGLVFDSTVWLLLLMGIFISALVLWGLSVATLALNIPELSRYTSISDSLSVSWTVAVGRISLLVPISCPLRTFFYCWTIYSYAINIIFQSQFTTYLLDEQFKRQISTVNDLVMSDFVFAFDRVFDDIFSDEFMKHLSPRYKCYNPFNCLQYSINGSNVALFSGRVFVEYESESLSRIGEKAELHSFKENMVQFHIPMVLQKGSEFLTHFNDIIARAVEAGLPVKFLRDFVDRTRLRNISTVRGLSYKALSTSNMEPVFVLLFIGQAASLALFLCEAMTWQMRSLGS
ncbi:hypothetical protein ANN_23369 [Periplaneta americana]|uniref:Ionotropic glutamate receptor L-glutamate and glycine-binding domain-containing protein n=1 Tax=Periplaneta americana TaxID=6978 RepID=A0ABQ8SLC4_PERAM|nr:hypothetical protein ANN_23369 [Periplaneta americana]